MKVLSLFDGMACGMLAMQKAGIEVDRYVAFEIDKYATQTSSHNFPMIEHRGDVFQADFTEFSGFDFLIGGSPCTYWSIAQSPDKRETTASGLGWELFSQYVRALHEAKPKFFIYENNKSMSKAIRESITETFGFEPICINSALVSAQNRQRLYWVGKRNADGTYSKVDVQQPEDRGILLRDVLANPCSMFGEEKRRPRVAEPVACRCRGRTTKDGKGYAKYECREDNKSNTLDTNTTNGNMVAEPVCVASRGRYSDTDSRSSKTDAPTYQHYEARTAKSVTQSAQGGGMGAKTGLYAIPVLKVREATRKGHIEVNCGELFDYEQPNSKTRRGRKMCEKSNCLTTSCNFYQYIAYAVEFNENGEPTKAVSKADGKTYTVYEVKSGNITIKGKTYPIKLVDGYYIIRKLTVSECKRLQTVPEWYEFPVSDTQAYKMLGNGWTVDVIAHILKFAKLIR